MELLYRDECYEIIGACMEVHNELGAGFLEAVYVDALVLELKARTIAYEREKKYVIQYKGEPLKHHYIADLLAFDKIIIELKAVKELDNIHTAQTINYLKASNKNVALLINFGQESLVYKRVVYGLQKNQ